MRSLTRFTLAAVAASSLVLAGCAATPAASDSTDTSGDEAMTLTFGNFGTGSASRFVMYAEELGYFADENLTVEFSSQQSTATLAQLLATGDLDMGYLSFMPAVDAREAGIDVRAVAISQIVEPGMQTAWVNTESGIDSLEALAAAGGKVALPSLGGYNELLYRVAFEEAGLDIGALEFTQVAPNDALGAMERGDVVSTSPTPPNRAAEIGKGDASKLAEIWDFADNAAMSGIYQGGVFANGEWAAGHEREITAFLAAVQRAVDEIGGDPVKDREMLAALAKLPAESAEHYVLETWIGEPDVAEIDRVLALMTEYKMLDDGKVRADDFLRD